MIKSKSNQTKSLTYAHVSVTTPPSEHFSSGDAQLHSAFVRQPHTTAQETNSKKEAKKRRPITTPHQDK
jgi:hypothetical protein